MQRVYKPEVSRLSCHNQGGGSFAGAEEAHAFEQCTVSHAGGRKDNLPARRQIVGVVDLVRIAYAHRLLTFEYLFLRWHLVFVNS